MKIGGFYDDVNARFRSRWTKQLKDFKDFVMPVDMTRMAYGGFQVEVEG